MTAWCRAGAGLVLLLAMIVSPMAPVLCALSCPGPGATTHPASMGHDAHAAPPQSAVSCHEDAAVARQRPVAPHAFVASGIACHQCQLPQVVTSSTVSDVLRLTPPMPATSMTLFQLTSAGLAPTTALPTSTRTPSARHVSGFSLALRI